MKKLIIIIILLLMSINIHALEYPDLHYSNAVVYDVTEQKTLYELNSTEERSIASLTKLMTIITAIENNKDLNKIVIYDNNMKNNVAWYASVAGFKVGDKLTVNDLLYAAMLPSGADATVALAISTSGSINEFIKEMNSLAKEIGMENTNFVNVHGLDEKNHYSTAEDIKKLLNYALKNETFKKVYTTKIYTMSTNKEIKSTVEKQAQKFNLDLSKVIGSKTGFTGDAGLCISILMNHKNHEIIFVTLGAPTTSQTLPYNISDSINLINFIETNYNDQILIEKNQIITEIPVENSKIERYKVKSTKQISLFLENDYKQEDIKKQYIGIEKLSYKNKKGEKIGKINYFYQGTKIGSEKVYLNQEIKPDLLKIIKSNLVEIIVILVIIIISIGIPFVIKNKKNL